MLKMLGYTFKDLKQELVSRRVAAHRAYQLFNWIYRKTVFDFDEMSDLPKAWRAELKAEWKTVDLETVEVLEDPSGETVKFLFKTEDGQYIESVLIYQEDDSDPDEGGEAKRVTLCVSSQAGCALGCAFCATGKLGFRRDLTASEIVSQTMLAERWLVGKGGVRPDADTNGRNITSIVFMGMGEPLLNYDNVLHAVRILNFNGGFNVGARHITISTAGITSNIKRLAEEGMQLRLALSLHAADQNKRRNLMPIAEKWKLPELMENVRDYQKTFGRRVTIEYVLLRGINDGEEDVLELKRLMFDLRYIVNVILYNPVSGSPFDRPTDNDVRSFTALLKRHGIPYVFRLSKGDNIRAGCGQLGLYWDSLKK